MARTAMYLFDAHNRLAAPVYMESTGSSML